MRAVILAGGKGVRLAPYTSVFPKPLMPIGDMPIMEIIIRQLSTYAFNEIFVSVGHLSRLIQAYFGDGSAWGVEIRYVSEELPLGTAGALALIPPSTEPTLVMNADVLSTLHYADLMTSHAASGAALTVGLFTKQVKIDLGVLRVSDRKVTEYIEKPTFDYQVSMGVYVVMPIVHDFIIRRGARRLDFPDVVSTLIADGGFVSGYPFSGYWLDIGRPADYEEAVAEFERSRSLFLPEREVVTATRLPRVEPQRTPAFLPLLVGTPA